MRRLRRLRLIRGHTHSTQIQIHFNSVYVCVYESLPARDGEKERNMYIIRFALLTNRMPCQRYEIVRLAHD